MGELITGPTYVEEIYMNTEKRYEIICITREVDIKDGLVLVNPMHITASCYVNDLEYGLHHDIMKWLEKSLLFTGLTDKTARNIIITELEKTINAHLKRQLLGQQVTMPVRLDFI